MNYFDITYHKLRYKMDLNLKSLEIFKAVVDEGSVSAAAMKLNRVQSNISTRIKQLEGEVQKQLFLRSGRSLKLTADGVLLLKYADQLLNLKSAAVDALSDDAPRGILRIGAMESTAAARLPQILAAYSKKYPHVHVDLITDTAAGLVERLARAEVDCIFAAESVSDDRFSAAPVFSEDLVLILPETFGEFEDFKQLNGQTLIAFEEGCAYRGYLEDWLKTQQVVPGNVLSISSYLAIFSCVSAGSGFALVPKSVLDLFQTSFPFQQIALQAPFTSIVTMMMWNKSLKSNNLGSLSGFFE
jgi:DNA-binding transcriptional LysR family regulator